MSKESISIVNVEQHLLRSDGKASVKKSLYLFNIYLRRFWKGETRTKLTAYAALI